MPSISHTVNSSNRSPPSLNQLTINTYNSPKLITKGAATSRGRRFVKASSQINLRIDNYSPDSQPLFLLREPS